MRCIVTVLLATAALAGPSTHDPVASRAQRRDRLAQHLGRDYGLVLGQPLTDVMQPRQEAHFLYLTGVDDPDAALLVAGAQARPGIGRRLPIRRWQFVPFSHFYVRVTGFLLYSRPIDPALRGTD